MYVCMYVYLGGAPIGFFSLLLPPVYFDELIIYNNNNNNPSCGDFRFLIKKIMLLRSRMYIRGRI